MRSGWALLGLTLVASAWAQGVLPPRIAYDAERNAYYVADELVVGLEPAGATALAQQAIRWVGRLQEVNVPLRSQLVRVEPHLNPKMCANSCLLCQACGMWSGITSPLRAASRTTPCLRISGD